MTVGLFNTLQLWEYLLKKVKMLQRNMSLYDGDRNIIRKQVVFGQVFANWANLSVSYDKRK